MRDPMNSPAPPEPLGRSLQPGARSERGWQVLIIASAAAVLLFSVCCLSHGITIIFMHLYYFPIVLLAYRYRYRGIAPATLLALAYVGLVYFYGADQIDVFIGAWFQCIVFAGIAAVVAYLSERLAVTKKATEESAEVKERYLSVAPAIVLALDARGAITLLNEQGCTILGCSRDDVIGKSWFDLFIPEKDRGRVRAIFQQLMNGQIEPARVVENPVVTRSGAERIIRWHNTMLHGENGAISGTLGFGEDVTEEKEAEEKFRKLQQFQESVIANANVWITVLASDGTILVWNTAAEEISGYKKDAVLKSRTIWQRLYPDKEYRKKVTGDIQRIIGRDNYLENFETEITCRDGSNKTVIWNTRGLIDTQGTVASYIAIGRDITERKWAEERLAANEEKFRQFFNNVNDALYLHAVGDRGLPGKFIEVNEVMCRRLGYSRDELLLLAPQDIVSEAGRLKMPAIAEEMTKKGYATFETEHCRKDGSIVPVEISSIVFSLAGTRVAMASARDITERKRAEDALIQSEERYRTLAEAYPDQIFISGSDDTIRYVNTTVMKAIGLSYDQVVGKKRKDLFPPEIAGIHDAALRKVLDTGETIHQEDAVRFGGQELWIDSKLVPLKDKAGHVTAVLGVARDITERKRMEEDLRQNQIRLATAMDLSKVVNWEYDVATGMFTFDDRFYALYGTTAEREGGHRMSAEVYAKEFVCQDDVPAVAEEIRKILSTTDPRYSAQIEHRIIRRDGTVRTIVARFAPVIGADGNVIKTFGANQDITERKSMEDALRESRQLFSDIISFLPDATLVIDREGKVLAWNRALEQVSSIPSKEMLGKGEYEYSLWQYGKRRPILIDLVLHPDLDYSRTGYTDIRKDGSAVTAETKILVTGGKELTFSLIASPLFDAGGDVIGAIESLRDITQLKEAEAELVRFNATLEQMVRERTQALEQEVAQRKKAEEDVRKLFRYTRSVIEANPDMMVVISSEGLLMDVNAAAEVMTGIPRQNLIGTLYTGYLIDDGTSPVIFSGLIRDGTAEDVFREIRHADGHITPILVSASVMKDSEGNTERIIAVAHDITKQKQDEAMIRASLDEKIILLREIHHRVKNNLQIIISLLSLQSRTITDPQVGAALKESTQRIRAMSMVHEKLYTGKDLSHIEFRNYVSSLANSQIAFYQTSPGKVGLEITGKDIMLDINTAIPLGLVVNELISNALKHAFPGERNGIIRIDARANSDRMEISIADDGIGLPDGTDWQNAPSLGLRLVTSLVEQLNGTITLDRTKGTVFFLSIPIKKE